MKFKPGAILFILFVAYMLTSCESQIHDTPFTITSKVLSSTEYENKGYKYIYTLTGEYYNEGNKQPIQFHSNREFDIGDYLEFTLTTTYPDGEVPPEIVEDEVEEPKKKSRKRGAYEWD